MMLRSRRNADATLRKIHSRTVASSSEQQPTSSAAPSTNNDIDVFIVPDAAIKSQHQADSLLRTIRECAPSADVYLWSWSWMPSAELNIFESLQNSGQQFFDVLQSSFDYTTRVRPLVLVGYGFGGIVIKQALNRLHSTSITKLEERLLRHSHHGNIFIGTPHPTYKSRESLAQTESLLKALKAFPKKHFEDNDSIRVIADICIDFQEGNHPPIFSFYEEQSTRVGLLAKLGLSRKGSTLLGPGLAEISNDRYRGWSIATDYHGLRKYRPVSKVNDQISILLRYATSTSIIGHLGSQVIIITTLKDAHDKLWDDPDNTIGALRHCYDFLEDLVARRIPKLPIYLRQPHDENPYFKGRSDVIKRLDEILLPPNLDGSGLRVCLLSGLAGIGKTQTSLHYTFIREDNFEAIFWIPADNDIKIAQAFRTIAEELGLADQAELKHSIVCRRLVLEWLSNPRKKRSTHQSPDGGRTDLASWLIIFDNASNVHDLRDHWPLHASGSILVTTRNAELAKTFPKACNLNMGLMPEGECIELLKELVAHKDPQTITTASVHSISTDNAASELANKLGFLPLAISQCAAVVKREGTTIDQFLKTEGKTGLLRKLMDIKSLPPEEQNKQTIKTLWDLENFTPQAQILMAVMVFMDPDSISEDILNQKLSTTSYSISGGNYETVRDELLKASIIMTSDESKTVSWHRIVRDVAEDVLETKAHFQSAIHLLSQSWPSKEDMFNMENVKLKEYDRLVPHIRYISRHPQIDEPLDMLSTKYLARLLQEAAWYLTELEEYGPVRPLLERAMGICESNNLKDRQAATAFTFARYSEETNKDPQVVFDYCEQSHRLAEELDDGSQKQRRIVATSHTSLAQGYLLLDKPREALEHCLSCIGIEAQFPTVQKGRDMAQLASIYGAWAWLELGEYSQATSLLEQVIEFRRRRFGPDDKQSRKLGMALQCLGNVRVKEGEINNGTLRIYQRALANFTDTLGPTSFRVGHVCLKLAELHAQLAGSDSEAKKLFDRAEKIFRQSDYHERELARCLYKYYEFQISREKDGEPLDSTASEHYDEAVRIYQKLVPDHQPGSDMDFNKIVRFWSR